MIGRTPVLTGRLIKVDRVGRCQRLPQRIGKNTQPHGIGAWLQHSQDALFANVLTQSGQRAGNSRRVMGKIVVNTHTANLAA